MRLLVLVCFGCVLSGCGKSTQVALAPTPQPVATIAPQPTLAPIIIQSNEPPPPAMPRPLGSSTQSAPTVNRSRVQRVPARSRNLNLTANEVEYVEAVARIKAMLAPRPEGNDSARVYISKIRARVAAANALHKSLTVTPRFVQASSLIKAGLDRANVGLNDIDFVPSGGGLDQDQAINTVMRELGDAEDLLDAGYKEVARVVRANVPRQKKRR